MAKFFAYFIIFCINLFAFSGFVSAKTYLPVRIDITAAELPSPMRGLYKNGTEIAPSSSSPDAYGRYVWSDLESSIDTYDFSVIDRDIIKAISEGRKFSFRIRVMKSKTSGTSYVPKYLTNDQYGWYSGTTFIPDWNNDYFIARTEKLLTAFGKHLDDMNYTKHINWVEIGIYGQYGEWALSSIYPSSCPLEPYPGSSDCEASDSNLQKIVDIHFRAFPNIRKVMMAKTRANLVSYALSKSVDVGWRVDCLGRPGYFNFPTQTNYATAWAIMQDRWKTAPVVVEYCTDGTLDASDPSQDDAKKQIENFHISAIANYNLVLSSDNTMEKYILNGKIAGYRIVPTIFEFPDYLSSSTLNIKSSWLNLGNAPLYEPWDIYYQLRNAQNTVVWEGKSNMKLKGFLPNSTTPTTVNDVFSINTGLSSGSYKLILIIKDPKVVRKPLPIAITGVLSDGGYELGTIGAQSANNLSNIRPGDLNLDNEVNLLDYNLLVAGYGTKYTIFDYNTLVSNYGK